MVYVEAGLAALNKVKARRARYGELKNRKPSSSGSNIPAFKLIDHLSREVEE